MKNTTLLEALRGLLYEMASELDEHNPDERVHIKCEVTVEKLEVTVEVEDKPKDVKK